MHFVRFVGAMLLLVGVVVCEVGPSAAIGVDDPIETIFGGNGPGDGIDQLNRPSAMTIDSDGTLYISDTNNNRVQRVEFAANGDPTTSTVAGGNGAGNGSNQLSRPLGLALGPDGDLFIADSSNSRVQRVSFAPDGTPTVTTAAERDTMGPAPTFGDPDGLAFAPNGELYVTTRTKIQKLTFVEIGPAVVSDVIGQNFSGTIDGQFDRPGGIAFLDSERLLVVDSTNHRLQLVTLNGAGPATAVTLMGGFGPGDDQLQNPRGLTIGQAGDVFVADRSNARVQEFWFGPEGISEAKTVRGEIGRGFANHELSEPMDVALDSAGMLYIVDSQNHRIRKLTSDRVAPSIVVNPVSDVAAGDTFTVNFSCDDISSDIEQCTATLDGSAVESGDAVAAGEAGSRELIVTAVDSSGNRFSITSTIVVSVASDVGVPSSGDSAVKGRHLSEPYRAMSGPKALLARLYMATYTRNPESAGFTYWDEALVEGGSMDEIAAFFVSSPEFVSLYGDTSNTGFVELMYRNVMGRSAEAEGKTFWIRQLDSGLTRSTLLLLFADSPEFRTLSGSA